MSAKTITAVAIALAALLSAAAQADNYGTYNGYGTYTGNGTTYQTSPSSSDGFRGGSQSIHGSDGSRYETYRNTSGGYDMRGSDGTGQQVECNSVRNSSGGYTVVCN